MYERFYELRERPFALSPDPDYLYPSRVHREALDYLRYGLESHAGFIVITGEIGSGKTTLLQTLLRGLDTQTTVGRIVNTMLEPRELLETIMIDFGLDPTGRSKPLLLRDLAQYLVDQRLAGRMVLLVIDEAQNLSQGALEELRMLSNLETEKSKLLQIVLVGQPNLRDKLAAPELEQLRQRITVSYHLQPLDAEETANYINHRLRRAALGVPLEFPRVVTDQVHARSRGVPRVVNVICDAALVFGYAEERRQVDLPLIHEVLGELEATGVLPPPTAPARVPAGALSAALARDPEPVERPRPEFAEAGRAEFVEAARGKFVESARPDLVDGARPDFFPAARPERVAAARPEVAAARPDIGAARREIAAARTEVAETAYGQPGDRPAVARSTYGAEEERVARAEAAARAALDARLAEREAAIRQRERELAEQRRILAEEYRLLRSQRAAVAAAPAGVTTGSGAIRVHVPGTTLAGSSRFTEPRPEGFWGWIKRVLFGISRPVVEEN